MANGAVFADPKASGTDTFSPISNWLEDITLSAFKDIRGEKKNPCICRKHRPPPIAISITEDALKGFSNDFLSIMWISKSQCPYSNSPGSKTAQQKSDTAQIRQQRQREDNRKEILGRGRKDQRQQSV